ncbi:MAG TPA: WYL domain-containing protein, partial [Sediminispirochaeta sp.]|nr:WYL domain-containing protein [Sediminispirochaeta sp.]
MKSKNKSERLRSIELILFEKPEGIRRAELARKLGVSRATISRDIVEMSKDFPIYEDESNRLHLRSLSALNSIRLTLPEIQMLSIASRLLSRKIRFPYTPAGNALRKLGEAIGKISPQYGRVIKKTADVFDFDKGENREYGILLDTLIKAVAAQKAVRLFHYSTRMGKETSYMFHIYHIEPHAEGNSLQVVGYAPQVGQIRTFKFERLTDIQILDEHYSIPSEFDADEYF